MFLLKFSIYYWFGFGSKFCWFEFWSKFSLSLLTFVSFLFGILGDSFILFIHLFFSVRLRLPISSLIFHFVFLLFVIIFLNNGWYLFFYFLAIIFSLFLKQNGGSLKVIIFLSTYDHIFVTFARCLRTIVLVSISWRNFSRRDLYTFILPT